jgi:hypothetical protein
MNSKYLLHTNVVLETQNFHNSVTAKSVDMNEKILDVGERWKSEVTLGIVYNLVSRVKNPANNAKDIATDVLRCSKLEQMAFCEKLCEDVVEHFTKSMPSNFISGGKSISRPEWLKRMGDVLAEMPYHIVIGIVRSRIGFENLVQWEMFTHEWNHMMTVTSRRLFSEIPTSDYCGMRNKYNYSLEKMSVVCSDRPNLGQ